jgi:hypothetical protein
MKISIKFPAFIEDPIPPDAKLDRLHGQELARGAANYLDVPLGDLGIVGGIIHVVHSSTHDLEISVDYWAPRKLSEEHLAELAGETQGQLSDGIGENGFDVRLGKSSLHIWADTDERPNAEQTEDHVPVDEPSAVARAARDGDMGRLAAELADGQPVDALLQGLTGLQLAITCGHVSAAVQLLAHGANPNVVDETGDTLLHICACTRSLDDLTALQVAKELIEHGADPKLTNENGDTAISLAIHRNRRKLAEYLRSQ